MALGRTNGSDRPVAASMNARRKRVSEPGWESPPRVVDASAAVPSGHRVVVGPPDLPDVDGRRTTEVVVDGWRFVLLVEDHELEVARVSNIADVMAAHGIDLVRFPIRDMDVTDDPDLQRFGHGETPAGAMAGQ